MQIRISVLTAILLLCSAYGYAQRKTESDSLIIESGDTVAIKSYAARYNPRKALLYASVVPGLGQIYNKKYWKLPLVYGGAFLIGRQINLFNNIYSEYKVYLYENLQVSSSDGTVHLGSGRTTAQLRRIVDRSRRERDFWIIMVGALYILQIVDSHVDAHLKEFDLNPNLRVSLQPTMEQNAILGRQTGLALTMKF
ncbi:DUF5683 domain-containing protein [Chryseosolibacter indicus]|uniref:DUF5683 domain-containing protein n=1 Tax=Chryseosolibacter indicus TaxID=2782351 RepID=A0ABS5VUU4_9BACT|nr:hypothetical protein [Chryseosolibacter indicus]